MSTMKIFHSYGSKLRVSHLQSFSLAARKPSAKGIKKIIRKKGPASEGTNTVMLESKSKLNC